MGWWNSPKSSSTSKSVSPLSPNLVKFTSDPNQPRLTRQKKLRHLSNDEVWDFSEVRSLRKDARAVSVGSTSVSRSPSSLDADPPTWRCESSPILFSHPLPSPRGFREGLPLPSPRELGRTGFSRLEEEINENTNGNMDFSPEFVVESMGGKLHPISVSGSKWACASNATTPKTPERFELPVVTDASRRMTMFHYSHTNEDLMLKIPDRSALTSGFNSPLLSPLRLSSRDIFCSTYLISQAPQARSGNWSPIHSPKARSPGTPNQMAPFSLHQSITNTEVSAMGNQWKRGKLIGSGTFGSVYLATNRNTGALCAMKEVNLIPDDPKSAECIKQLQQEIKFLSCLKHSNIVQYYGSEMIKDRFCIYLEYVYPGSIDKYVCDNFGHITESVVRSFTRHILTGLAYLHSKNTVHRDIKGANLLVNSNGIVKLADFGMAKHLCEASIAYSMMGSPYWMAPEVLQASIDKKSGYNSSVDIWSLGCTVIQMFTGKQPWSDLAPAAALFKVLHESPQLPEALSFEGKDFLKHCFCRNPEERPSASDLMKHPFVTTHFHQYNNIHSSVKVFAQKKPFR